MPRPMMPTQLTVLTSASTSAVRMSPVVNLIMRPSIVPVAADFDGWPVLSALHRIGDLLHHSCRINADSLNKVPREATLVQELGLFAFLDLPRNIPTGPAVRGYSFPIDFVQA